MAAMWHHLPPKRRPHHQTLATLSLLLTASSPSQFIPTLRQCCRVGAQLVGRTSSQTRTYHPRPPAPAMPTLPMTHYSRRRPDRSPCGSPTVGGSHDSDHGGSGASCANDSFSQGERHGSGAPGAIVSVNDASPPRETWDPLMVVLELSVLQAEMHRHEEDRIRKRFSPTSNNDKEQRHLAGVSCRIGKRTTPTTTCTSTSWRNRTMRMRTTTTRCRCRSSASSNIVK